MELYLHDPVSWPKFSIVNPEYTHMYGDSTSYLNSWAHQKRVLACQEIEGIRKYLSLQKPYSIFAANIEEDKKLRKDFAIQFEGIILVLVFTL